MKDTNDTLVIDVETKKAFAEVGGEQNIRQLGVSVAGVYSYDKDDFFALEEHELPRLNEWLEQADHVIGFNIHHFDIPVLEPYLGLSAFDRVAVTDIFRDAVEFLGHRIGLNALAKATLGAEKSGHGLEALQWFREGRVEEVKQYCLDDVRLTRDLYEYGKKHGHLLFTSRADGKVHSIPVQWGERAVSSIKQAPSIKQVVEDAFKNRTRLMIEYISSENGDGAGFRKARLIDVYEIRPGGRIVAYCHLRKSIRDFALNRIVRAEPTQESYALPQQTQQALFF